MLSVAVDQKIAEGFAQLIQTGEDVARHVQTDSFSSTVDIQTSSQWGVSCLSLLNRVFSRESDHYRRFDKEVDLGAWGGDIDNFLSIFAAPSGATCSGLRP